MINYAWMGLKIGVHTPFGPKFPVEFVHFDKRYLGTPLVDQCIITRDQAHSYCRSQTVLRKQRNSGKFVNEVLGVVRTEVFKATKLVTAPDLTLRLVSLSL